MKKTERDCPSCPAFGHFCPRAPNKEDYKFPEEENQYLIDKECGVYSCREAIGRMSAVIDSYKESMSKKRRQISTIQKLT